MNSKNKPDRPNTNIFSLSQNKSLCIIICMIIGLLASSLCISVFVERKNKQQTTSYMMQLLSKYTSGISNEINMEIKKITAQLISVMELKAPLTDKNLIKTELHRISRENYFSIRNAAVFYRNDNAYDFLCISSLSTDDENTAEHYQEVLGYKLKQPTPPDLYPVLLQPYEEKLGNSIIIPCQINNKKQNSFTLFEINLIQLLRNLKGAQRTNILTHDIPITINIYSFDGTLLESTVNIKRKTIPTLEKDNLYQKFNYYNNNLELFTITEKDTIWMMKRDAELGLAVAIMVPVEFLNKNMLAIRLSILSITLLSILAIILILLLTLNVAKNYQLQEQMKADARFLALQNKMRPHLLFNTLDSIVYTIESKNISEALASIRALAYILQIDLRDNNTEIPVTKQVKYLRSYVELQEIRYKNKFKFNLDIDLGDYSMESLKILKFCIQPLVENCFVYSVHQNNVFTHIDVMYQITNCLIITVKNDGSHITPERIAELQEAIKTKKTKDYHHIGLLSINDRIKLRYGNKYGADVAFCDGCFIVTLQLPIITE